MAALDTNTTLFGDKATSCPATITKMVDIARTVDLAKTTIATGTNYELIALPKDFLLTGIALEQTEKASASCTVTVKAKGDSSTIGSAITLSADEDSLVADYKGAVAGASGAADGVKFLGAGDTLCVVFGAAATEGKFTLHAIGYQVFGKSLSDYGAVPAPWTSGQTEAQAADNVSGGDPMFDPQNVKRT